MSHQLLLELLPATEENLTRGHARCACSDCWELVPGEPASVLCLECEEAGCKAEGDSCNREAAAP